VPRLATEVEAHLRHMAPQSRAVTLDREPAHGAVALALAELRGETRLPTYRTS
jgi:hypothetical protein